MITAIVCHEFKFEAAHRLIHHKGKCRNLHGHSYRGIISVEGQIDPTTGMVIDFNEFLALDEWIDKNLDHAFIANVADSVVVLNGESRVFWMPHGWEATAENIAIVIRNQASIILKRTVKVQLWETAKNSVIIP